MLLALAFLPAIHAEALGKEETTELPENGVEIVYPDGWSYHDYYEVTDYLQELESKCPDMVDLYSIGQSVKGRELWCIQIGSGPVGVLIDGGHHGVEAIATEVALYFVALLLENQDNPKISWLLEERTFYVIPLVSPDGRQRAECSGYLGRFNYHFVDLNRDYIDFSEPESRAIAKFMEEVNFSVYLTLHSGAYSLVYPWGYAPGDEPFDMPEEHEAVYEIVAEWVVENTDIPEGNVGPSAETMYVAVGCSDDYCYGKHLVPSFTYECYSPESWVVGKFIEILENPSTLLPSLAELPSWILGFIFPLMWSSYNPPESSLPDYMPKLMSIPFYLAENAEALGDWDVELMRPSNLASIHPLEMS
jgi:hypothetical protein